MKKKPLSTIGLAVAGLALAAFVAFAAMQTPSPRPVASNDPGQASSQQAPTPQAPPSPTPTKQQPPAAPAAPAATAPKRSNAAVSPNTFRSKRDLCDQIKSSLPDAKIVDWGADTGTGFPLATVSWPERSDNKQRRETIDSNFKRRPAESLMQLVRHQGAADTVQIREAPTEAMALYFSGTLPADGIRAVYVLDRFILWGDSVRIEEIKAALGL